MIEQASRLLWLALAFTLPLAFMPGAMNPFAPVKRDIFFVLGLVQLCLLVLRSMEHPLLGVRALAVRPVVGPLLVMATLLIFGAWTGLVTPLNASSLLEPTLGMILALGLLAEKKKDLGWRFLLAQVIGTTAGAAYGLAQFAGFDPLTWQKGFAGAAPPATYGNPLFLGDGILAALPVALILAMGRRGGMRRTGLALAMILAATLVVTQARGAWLGAAVGIALLAYLTGRNGRRKLLAPLAILGGVAAVLVAIFSFPNTLNVHGANIARHAAALAHPRSGEFLGRILLWHGTALLARERPVLGAGPGQLAGRYTEFQGELLARTVYAKLPYHSTSHAHQDLLQLLAERGVIGLGVTLWLLAVVFKLGLRTHTGPAEIAALCALAAWLVDGLFNGPLHLPPSSIQFWFLIAIAARGAPVSLPVHKTETKMSPIARSFWPSLTAAAVFLLAARPFGRDLLSEAYLRAGDYTLRHGSPALALPLSLRALAFAAEDRRHHFCLGEIYYALGELPEAAEEFALDTKINPGAASSWHNLGVAELRANRVREALAAFARARRINPHDPELLKLIEEAEEKAAKKPLTEGAAQGKLK